VTTVVGSVFTEEKIINLQPYQRKASFSLASKAKAGLTLQ